MRVRTDWSKTHKRDPAQVRCLTADAGHVWMHCHDALPAAVRRRLAASPFNLCAACVQIETERLGAPTVAAYFHVIAAIERELRKC